MEGLQLLQQPSHKHTLPEILCVDEKFNEVLTSETEGNTYQKAQQTQYTEKTYAIT